jgi:hypothetical protein
VPTVRLTVLIRCCSPSVGRCSIGRSAIWVRLPHALAQEEARGAHRSRGGHSCCREAECRSALGQGFRAGAPRPWAPGA